MKVNETIIKSVRCVFVLIWFHGYLAVKRSPFSIANFVLTPLSILFFIYIFGGARAATYGLIGGVLSVTVSSSIIVETDAAFARIVLRIQDMFVASPVAPAEYAVGLALSELMNGIVGIALFLILLVRQAHTSAFGLSMVLASLFLVWACVTSLGFLISSFARDVRDLWVYSPIITILLSFVPPVYYPISVLPSFVRPLAFLSPTTYAAQVMRITSGLATGNAQVYLGALSLYTLVLVLLASKRVKWRAS
ncbi:hypothetical protein B9Q12_02435 [Candidatus Marsarchaeota G2 archaeon ECH_B_SAG-G06]|uniref:ABC transmembrane type-2 domain-containing protein n=3 Tax=Candidatus Marsarchaeota TaxID=1978152 RepID=A0A2R6C0K9_9ARCH|nr:MAG: hypothetical protein B9Q12_02435 [Candidatus Marsarchaeota G2 archaeon ECH_B_SAG-G06]